MDYSVSVILLAGGKGSRMNSHIPKQFLELQRKPIILHSFEFFLSLPNIKEIIVVCEPSYQSLFEKPNTISLKFALPGYRRQDSVFNGLQQACIHSTLICIHDGARPFLNELHVKTAFEEALAHGASTLAVPLKFTVKENDTNGFIKKTLDRSKLFEIQTPQIIRQDLLASGFAFANEHNLEVTDDVSLIELLKKPVKLVTGSYQNIKITTKEDLSHAESIIQQNELILL